MNKNFKHFKQKHVRIDFAIPCSTLYNFTFSSQENPQNRRTLVSLHVKLGHVLGLQAPWPLT